MKFVIGKVSNDTVSWDFFRDLIAQVEAVLVKFPLGAVSLSVDVSA
jgi:hypothetical protein